ncbi:MAG: serine/threonine-protein kinase [Polyangiaceae bacterium]
MSDAVSGAADPEKPHQADSGDAKIQSGAAPKISIPVNSGPPSITVQEEANPISGAGLLASDPPADPVTVPVVVDPLTASAANAITHLGPACPSCSQLNHPGTARCVFCGHTFAVAEEPENAWRPISTPPPHEGPRRVDLASTEPPPPSDAAPISARAPSGAVELRFPNGDMISSASLSPSQVSQPSQAGMRKSTWSTSFEDMHMPVADPLIGVVVADRYRIAEGLGRGGMGIVYKVEHKQIGKLLAMKLLTGELSRNPEVVRRFKHEALTSSRLSSPNTVQVFDFGVSDGLTYLVMELVAGEDLSRILRASGPMPWSRLGKVVIQICSSLTEAHAKGIVHRDIKPENIMLVKARDGSDLVKVLDFGLAKLREGEGLSELTSAGAIVGTPYFMSPEQVRGDPVDARSDIYSLGALMYRALTGHYPFNGPTPMSVFTKHLTENPIPPIERTPELGIPPGVSRLVMKALHKNPAERFQKVEELQVACVEQLRAVGTNSVETLLDSGAVRKLGTEMPKEAHGGAAIATRDEVERYERKLRRQKYGVYAVLLVMLGAAGTAGYKYWESRKVVFNGVEIEPNDNAGEATHVPFGANVSGYLGRRISKDTGDRDFFEMDIPPSAPNVSFVSIDVTALPNIPMCTLLYRGGLSTVLGRYCVGRPGRDLAIPALRLEPGKYFVAVMQDMDPYGGPVPFVHENISDPYTVSVKHVERPTGVEVEPNDQIGSATSISVGETVSGALGWTRDEDVYCAHASAGESVSFRVSDSARASGNVIEVTPLRGTEEGAAVRVHAIAQGTVSSTDVVGPWTTPPVMVEPDVPRCIRVKASLDPWMKIRVSDFPTGGPEPYKIELVGPR